MDPNLPGGHSLHESRGGPLGDPGDPVIGIRRADRSGSRQADQALGNAARLLTPLAVRITVACSAAARTYGAPGQLGDGTERLCDPVPGNELGGLLPWCPGVIGGPLQPTRTRRTSIIHQPPDTSRQPPSHVPSMSSVNDGPAQALGAGHWADQSRPRARYRDCFRSVSPGRLNHGRGH